MCHCAPVFKIHNTASRIFRDGTGFRPGRPQKYSLPENDAGYAPNPNRSAESSNTYSPSEMTRNFEIGSNLVWSGDADRRRALRAIDIPGGAALINSDKHESLTGKQWR